MTADEKRSDGRIDYLLRVNNSYMDIAFLSLIFAFCVYVLYASMGYSARARSLPLLITVVTILLIGSLFLKSKLDPENSVFGTTSIEEGDQSEIHEQRTNILRAFGWIVGIFLVVYLLGIDTGTFAFLLLYYRYESGLTWLYAVGYSVLTWVPIVVLFFFVLNIRLYGGILFG